MLTGIGAAPTIGPPARRVVWGWGSGAALVLVLAALRRYAGAGTRMLRAALLPGAPPFCSQDPRLGCRRLDWIAVAATTRRGFGAMTVPTLRALRR
jgi:hypothetical protein